MERKSIGTFIAILRKANGMTQKELAEKLGISDKAVSRWERDETAPDLSLIPAIAEIFGVTSDELLRGERAGEKDASPEKQAEKTEKQIKNLLKNVRTKFFTKTLICVLIATVGLFAAMICNFVFFQMQLGFIVACIFLSTALVLEIIFAYLAYASIDDEDIESTELPQTRRYIVKKALMLVTVVVSLFAYCIPLLFTSPYITISAVKINFGSWFLYGMMFALIVLVLCFVANVITDRIAEKKDVYSVPEKIKEKRARRLKKFNFFARPALSLFKVFVPLAVVTIIAHIVCLCTLNIDYFLKDKGTTFCSIEEFTEYMDTLGEDDPYRTANLYTDKGSYVCSYKPNAEIGYIKVENFETNSEPVITAYTNEEYYYAWDIAVNINACFVIAYIAEGAVFAVLYTVKTVKAYKKEKSE